MTRETFDGMRGRGGLGPVGKSGFWSSGALVCVLAALGVLGSACTMDSWMFNATHHDEPYDFSDTIIPADKFDPAGTFIQAEDGTRIEAFFVESSGEQPDRADVTVFYCHGNRDSLFHYWPRVELFYRMGYQTLIFDYRGFGHSEGTPTEQGLYMDAEAAFDYLLTIPQVDPDKIVFYGYSLGVAVCVELAKRLAEHPRSDGVGPFALITESGFRSVSDLVQDGATFSLAPGFVTTLKFDNYAKIDKVGVPLFLLHGTRDDYVWVQYGKDLYDKALDPKQLWLVGGATHTDVPGADGSDRRAEYMRRVPEFIQQYLPGAGT